MKRFYHFSRKRRQLKNKLKAYQTALVSIHKETIDKLRSQILRLSIYSDRKLFKQLVILGILCALGNPIKAQDILLNPPTPVHESMNLILAPHSFIDSIYPFYGMDKQNVRQTRFVDVDADGDLDVFFTVSSGCNTYGFNQLVNRLLFQENISTDTIAFDSIKQLLSFPTGASFPFPFDIVNFDNDSDYDLLLSDFNGFTIYENNSNQFDEFYFNSPNYVSMSNGTIGSFYISDLLDIDNDGDLDLITNSFYDFNNLFYYKNNGSNSIFPFDTIREPLNLNLQIDTAIVNSAFLAFDFIDIDNDGNEDLLIQADFYEDDLNDYLYPKEARLYYYKNLGNSGFNFDPIGQQLIETDLKYTPPTPAYYNVATFFNAVDIDGDGDIDISENRTGTYVPETSYCSSSYTYIESVYIYKNVIEEITGLSTSQNTLDFELLGNPTHDKSILNFKNEAHKLAEVKVYNSTGVLVEHIKTNQSSLVIDRENLANGIYFFSLQIDDMAGSGKLIFTD